MTAFRDPSPAASMAGVENVVQKALAQPQQDLNHFFQLLPEGSRNRLAFEAFEQILRQQRDGSRCACCGAPVG